MTLPRQVVAGRTLLLTRRCAERRFFLRPSPGGEAQEVLLYGLALAAERHGVEVHGFCALSNHVHGVVTDVEGELPRFAQQLHGNVARAINVHLGRGEALWATGKSYSAVHCVSREDVLARLVYTICNPVAAGLVDRPEDWPGVRFLPEDVGREVLAPRPRFFFRAPGDGEGGEGGEGGAGETARDRARGRAPARGCLPDVVRLRITRPPQFGDLTDAEFARLLRERVDAQVAAIHAEREARGLTRSLGVQAILRQDPYGAPPGGTRPEGDLNPRVAARDPWKRIEAKQALAAFWVEHRRCFLAFRAGHRRVAFPAGTWAAVRVMGARARPAA